MFGYSAEKMWKALMRIGIKFSNEDLIKILAEIPKLREQAWMQLIS